MLLTQTLGKEIKDYIMNLLGKEAIIVGNNGVCLSSPNQSDLGKKSFQKTCLIFWI